MSETVKEDIISEVEALLKKLDLEVSDYQKKSTDRNSAHVKTIEALGGYWFSKRPYLERYGLQGIDFLGKDGKPEGHILVAVEVDAGWWGSLGSSVKLANIRAENKIWIHVSGDEKAEENFDRALKEIQKLLTLRGETKETFGNFAIFLKTPDLKDFKMKRIF